MARKKSSLLGPWLTLLLLSAPSLTVNGTAGEDRLLRRPRRLRRTGCPYTVDGGNSGGGITRSERLIAVFPSDTIPLSDQNQTMKASNRQVLDEPHLVGSVSRTGGKDGMLRVFLPGTGRSPLDYSCLLASVLSASDEGDALIGLSYGAHAMSDADRNAACLDWGRQKDEAIRGDGGNAVNRVDECLSRQHSDALFGSDNPHPMPWPAIDVSSSVAGRLGSLLRHLASSSENGGGGASHWSSFLSNVHEPGKRDEPAPRWDRIWLAGHSQGAGHAAHLAKGVELAGAGLLSGPQDEHRYGDRGRDGDGSRSHVGWILGRGEWATRDIRAMAHHREDATKIIRNNWAAMRPFLGLSWEVIKPPFSKSPPPRNGTSLHGPWLTDWPPQPNATACASRPYHCSTALDGSAPLLMPGSGIREGDRNEDYYDQYLHAESIWPHLAGIDRDNAVATKVANTAATGVVVAPYLERQGYWLLGLLFASVALMVRQSMLLFTRCIQHER